MSTNNATPARRQPGEGLILTNHDHCNPDAVAAQVIDYTVIKRLAKDWRCSVKDLIALAPQNDPFYCGTPADIAMAEWFAGCWHDAGYTSGVHLRRIHYWCVVQGALPMHNGKPYENTIPCWQYLCTAAKYARYLDYVAMGNIADHKTPKPHIMADYFRSDVGFCVDVPELSRPSVSVHGFKIEKVKPFHLEVWIEKTTMNDVLLPVCNRFNANLVAGEGEMTASAVELLKRRAEAADIPARIFYISDFDPAGQSMPKAVSRKLEFLIRQTNIDVKIMPIAMNLDQVHQYDLPRVPIKQTETRAAKFEDRFGEGAVELDALEALHPGVLAGMVRDTLSAFYCEDSVSEMRKKESALRLALRDARDKVIARYTDEIEALQRMQEELYDLTIPNMKTYEPQRASIERFQSADESHDWLFDSGRDYFEQLAAYKRFSEGAA